jgi:pyrimidine 5'-nucleotidase
MKKIDPKNIKLIIFDLDGTLYSYDTDEAEYSDFEAVAKAISQLLNINYDKALKLTKESYRKYGMTFELFLNEHNISFKELEKLYFHFLSTDFLKPDKKLNEILENLPMKKIVYTHSNNEWMKKVLKKLEMYTIMDVARSYHSDNFLCKKNESFDTFKKICEEQNVPYENTLFIDDKDINLKYAKKLGIKTILLNETEEKSPYADACYKDINSAFKALSA